MSVRRLRIILTNNAWEVLVSILQYSAQTWGEEQRSIYQALIDDTLRSHPAGTHVIYYWTTEKTFIVAHILHGRQDPARADWTNQGE